MAKRPENKAVRVELVSPDGRAYTATSALEATRLRARGYRAKPEAKTQKAPESPAPTQSKK